MRPYKAEYENFIGEYENFIGERKLLKNFRFHRVALLT